MNSQRCFDDLGNGACISFGNNTKGFGRPRTTKTAPFPGSERMMTNNEPGRLLVTGSPATSTSATAAGPRPKAQPMSERMETEASDEA